MTATHPDFLTVPEVAALLRCSSEHARRCIRAGRWPVVRVGRRYRLPRAWVDSLLHAAPVNVNAAA
jgi:excisionase family DNA binding protein